MESRGDGLVALLREQYALAPPVTSFGLEHAGLNNVNTGIRTGAGTFVARVYESLSYEDAASVAYEHRLLDWLAGQGLSFAVPVPIPTRDGASWCEGPDGRISLAPKLPGLPLALQSDEGGLLGSATGELQVVTARHQAAPRPGRLLYDELFRFASPALEALTLRPGQVGLDLAEHDELFGWWRDEAARVQVFVDGDYRALPWQLCHNDVTPNNVLAEDGVVAAVLDFEYAIPIARALDFEYTIPIARALDFVTGLRTAMPYFKNPAPWAEARAYGRGFARWVSLTDAEIAAVPDLLRLRSAITVLWWIGRAAATGTAGPLVSRMRFCRELCDWLARAEAPLLEVVRQSLRASLDR